MGSPAVGAGVGAGSVPAGSPGGADGASPYWASGAVWPPAVSCWVAGSVAVPLPSWVVGAGAVVVAGDGSVVAAVVEVVGAVAGAGVVSIFASALGSLTSTASVAAA